MEREHILVVDDEEDILELVRYHLEREHHRVSLASSGEEAIEKIRSQPPHLVILDLMLPGIDGLETARIIKADPLTKDISIIMLTAKGEEVDVVTGLELGADDYVTKPFSPRVLVARVKTVLRRRKTPVDEDSVIRIHNLVIHPGRREVLVDGRPAALTYSEFSILAYLARRPGWVFTRTQIVDAVRGDDYPVTDRSVDVQIVGLRRKLGHAGSLVETVRGVGYRFKE
ncbi:MAG: response regulator transcription factor [Desulfobacteraceae bacterium]